MHIAFEAKRAFNNFTGLGNYSRFVISALKENYPEEHYSLYTPKISKREEAANFYKQNKEITVMPSGLWKAGSMKSAWRSKRIGKLAVKQKADVFHGLSNELPSGLKDNIKKIVTIHDLIFLRYPDFYPFIDRKIYKKNLSQRATRQMKSLQLVSKRKLISLIFLMLIRPKLRLFTKGCIRSINRI